MAEGPGDVWGEYRRRMGQVRRSLWLGIPAAVGALVAALQWAPSAALVVVAGWLLLVALTTTYAEYCPCPRCGEPFSRKGLFHNLFTKRCLHCELPKWSTGESIDAPADPLSAAGSEPRARGASPVSPH